MLLPRSGTRTEAPPEGVPMLIDQGLELGGEGMDALHERLRA
jgi:hypothetical protein